MLSTAEPTRPVVHRHAPSEPTHPERLLRWAIELTGLSYRFRVLDLSSGQEVARDLTPHAKSVVRALPAAAGDRKQPARELAEELHRTLTALPSEERYRLLTVDRNLHDVGGEPLLEHLDRRVETGGALATFALRFPDVPENRWVRELELRYGCAPGALRSPTRWHPAGDELLLLRSPFDHLECLTVIERRAHAVDHVLERLLRHEASKGRPAAGAEALRALLLAHADHAGQVREIVEGHALVARRSRDLSKRWG